jgi:hypothetical protein
MASFNRLIPAIGLSALVVTFWGCATTQNTLAQDLAWERAEKCKRVANIQINRVEPDGRIWYQHTSGGGAAFDECLKQAAAEQARRRVAPAPPVAVASGSIPLLGSSGGAAATAGVPMPIWKVGDEWAYRQESPDSAITFVWSVDDIEKIDGVEHYVVKSAQRRIYLRTADGALTLQKVSGAVTNRYTPGWAFIVWPLTTGKTWETNLTEERVEDRITEEIGHACEIGSEEKITVPAGTFSTIPITCRNQRTRALVYQEWYAPAVKHFVREVWWQKNGRRLRELIAYRLR